MTTATMPGVESSAWNDGPIGMQASLVCGVQPKPRMVTGPAVRVNTRLSFSGAGWAYRYEPFGPLTGYDAPDGVGALGLVAFSALPATKVLALVPWSDTA